MSEEIKPCRCYEIGGPFIAEDPDCPMHGPCGVNSEFEAKDARIAELEKRIQELEYWAQFACETPAVGCDCPGCSFARAENEKVGES